MGATESLDQEGFSEQHVGKEQVEDTQRMYVCSCSFHSALREELESGLQATPTGETEYI